MHILWRPLVVLVTLASGSNLALATPASGDGDGDRRITRLLSTTPGKSTGSGCGRGRAPVRALPRGGVRTEQGDVAQMGVSSVVPSMGNGLTNVYFQQRVNPWTCRPRCSTSRSPRRARCCGWRAAPWRARARRSTAQLRRSATSLRPAAAAEALGLRPTAPSAATTPPRATAASARSAMAGLARPDHRAAGLPGDQEGCAAAGVGAGDQPARRPALVADPDGRRHR